MFLGNTRAENYRDIVQNLIKVFQAAGCNMSLKIHFLDSHIDFLPSNLDAVSDKHSERFHHLDLNQTTLDVVIYILFLFQIHLFSAILNTEIIYV